MAAPPALAPAETLFALDVETTGFSAKKDWMTEVACVVVQKNGTPGEHFTQLIKPPVAIPEKITQITGINDALVEDAPSEGVVMRRLASWVNLRAQGSQVFVVAHKADFDRSFIEAACKRHNVPVHHWIWVCSLKASFRLLGNSTSHKLADVYAFLGHGTFDGAHRAGADAVACARVFRSLSAGKSAYQMALEENPALVLTPTPEEIDMFEDF
jgi:DNA polymerase-3 subunit alpha (Gram-positive type)